jgi:hypothetical protein
VKTAGTPEEARAVIEAIAREYAPPFHKLTSDSMPPGTPKLERPVMAAAIVRARELGMRPVGHISDPDDALFALEQGLDLLAHPPFTRLLTPATWSLERLVFQSVPPG